MKILFVASGNVKSNFTYRVMALGRALKKLGHEVVIIAPKADKYNNFVSETVSNFEGVHIVQPFQFTTKRMELNLLPYLFAAAYQVLKIKPDVVYIYKPTPISIVGLLSKLFRRTPVLLDMDDLGSEVMKLEGHPFYQRKLVEWCERLAARYANGIVAASGFLRDAYAAAYPQKPVLLLPNGVEQDWFAGQPSRLQRGENKRIVFMGSLNRKDILEPLLNALPAVLQSHPTVRVVVMGDGQCLPYFKQQASKLKISKHVSFAGWLKLDVARTSLQFADIGYSYMPNERTIRAASNMKVPQYMARGVVPLVSKVGDLPSVVDNGKAGYIVAPDDVRALEVAIIDALNDPGRFKKAHYAQSFARDMFLWDKQAANFYSWLEAADILYAEKR